MTPARWGRLKEIFAEALDRQGVERDRLVERACEGDPELLREARRLLASHEAAMDYLSNPAIGPSGGEEPPPPLFAPQQTVGGRFRIVRFIARGGMGEVYEAEDLTLSTNVALKTVQPHIAGEHTLQLFRQEILSARRVTHPNVCRIYDIAEHLRDGDLPVSLFTMELLEGPTLSAYLKEHGPFSRNEAMPLIQQLAAGLQAGHDAGVIHCDFKPANVILSRGPNGLRPVITDFGLAWAAGPGPKPDDARGGTPGYMAPEQIEGGPATPATDVYALGVVIRRMIGGALIAGSPRSSADAGPGPWRHVIDRCLEKDPALRYQRPAMVAAALRRSPMRSSRTLMMAGGAAVAGLWGVVWLTHSSPVSSEVAHVSESVAPRVEAAVTAPVLRVEIVSTPPALGKRIPFQNIEVTRLTTIGRVGIGAISPNDSFVAYILAEPHQQSLWVKRLSTGNDVQLIPPRETNYFALSFSPDGQWIRYGEGGRMGTLYEIPLAGGAERKLSDHAPRGSFSPDGQQYAYSRLSPDGDSELVIAPLDGSASKTIASLRPPRAFETLAWSPDGTTIACLERGLSTDRSIVWISAESSAERATTTRWRDISSIAWLPGGAGMIVNARDAQSNESQIWEIDYPSGDARRITHDVTNYFGDISLSSNGRNAVVAQLESDSTVWVTNDGSESNAVRATSDRSLHDGGVAWMPDGSLVYSSSRRTPKGDLAYDLWLAAADGSNARRVMADGINLHPRPCPNGNIVVFHHTGNTTGDPKTGVWSVDLRTGRSRQLTSRGNFPDCSATGWVVYTIAGGAALGVWRVPVEGGEVVRLTAERAAYPVVSPDGTTVAYSYGRGFAELSIDGSWPTRKHDGAVESIRWAPDGRSVVALRTNGDARNAWNLPLGDTSPKQLTHFRSNGISLTGWDWSRDGLAYVQENDRYDLVLIRDKR